jgi:hypothetical protein
LRSRRKPTPSALFTVTSFEALAWLEIHGGPAGAVEHWKALLAETEPPDAGREHEPVEAVPRRRRRRRRRPYPTAGH